MDKTFAPDFDTACKIIDLAKKYNTPLFSSSSLRFCSEFEGLERGSGVLAFGGGHNFDIEVIHPIEICAHLMGTGAEKLVVYGDRTCFTAHLFYSDKRSAEIFFCEGCKGFKYGAIAQSGGTRRLLTANSDFFQLLTNAMAEFFKSKVSPLTYDDILEGIKIRDGIIKALDSCGEIVKI